jgi:multidrug efflux pump subunit AcrB
MVPTETGRMVPLSSLVDIRYSGGFGSINRKDLDRMVTITASNEGRLSTEVLADCRERLDDLPLPAGYTLEYGGEDEEREKAQSFLTKAFVAAIFMITLVLVSEFDSVSTPLIIMAAVAFSMAGALVGLLVTRQPFGIIMTGIGMISLAGVVVNNGIVLLDYVEKLRTRGLERTEALVRAGMTRLRPVVLTAATTILGLIPMATGISYDFRNFNWILKSESSLWWGQMAMTIIFGLTIATVLTLVLVPTMYSLLDDVRRFLGHAWHPKGELNGGGAGPGEGEAA